MRGWFFLSSFCIAWGFAGGWGWGICHQALSLGCCCLRLWDLPYSTQQCPPGPHYSCLMPIFAIPGLSPAHSQTQRLSFPHDSQNLQSLITRGLYDGAHRGRLCDWYSKPVRQGLSLLFSRSVVSDSLPPHELQPTRLLCPWDFPGKNTEVGCHSLLQGIFLIQGSNPRLLCWQLDSLPLSQQGGPQGLSTVLNKWRT